MANPEHLEILKQGVEVWNKWREESLGVKPDLAEADLHGMDLREANLYAANLSSADLCGANLREASLVAAYLPVADLIGADLGEATLSGACLRSAELTEARIIRASLNRADVAGAIVGLTVFGDVDLRGVCGLDEVIHLAPSFVSIDTVLRSEGHIPEHFLRGCGVPDQFITYMRSLVGRAIEYYSCFISYSSQDDEFAQRLHADLQDSSVRCWFAPHDLKIGDRIRPTIDEAIRLHDKLCLILSQASVASTWVEAEVESAMEQEQRRSKEMLFPIRLDDAVMESEVGWAAHLRRTCHIGDFTEWKDHDAYRKAFERLLRDLKASSS